MHHARAHLSLRCVCLQRLDDVHQVVRQRCAVTAAQCDNCGCGGRARVSVLAGDAHMQHARVHLSLRRVCLQRLDNVHQAVRRRLAQARSC